MNSKICQTVFCKWQECPVLSILIIINSLLHCLLIPKIWTLVVPLGFDKFSEENVFSDPHRQKHCACVTCLLSRTRALPNSPYCKCAFDQACASGLQTGNHLGRIFLQIATLKHLTLNCILNSVKIPGKIFFLTRDFRTRERSYVTSLARESRVSYK